MAKQAENHRQGSSIRLRIEKPEQEQQKPEYSDFWGKIRKYGLIPAGMAAGFALGSLFPDFKEVEVEKEVRGSKLVVQTVAKGENMWSIVKDKYGITDNKLIAERVNQIADSSPLARHKIDNVSVVNGKVKRAGDPGYVKDHIRGDQIRPGDELFLNDVPYTRKVKVNETREKKWPNWLYGAYGAAIGGALGALGVYFSRRREDEDNDDVIGDIGNGKYDPENPVDPKKWKEKKTAGGMESDIKKIRDEIEKDYESGKYTKEPEAFTDSRRMKNELMRIKPSVYTRYVSEVDNDKLRDVDQGFINSIEELVTLYNSGKRMKGIAKDSSYACFQDADDVKQVLSLALKNRKKGQYLKRFNRDLASSLKDEEGTSAIKWLKREYKNKGKTGKKLYQITDEFRDIYGMSISKNSLYNCVQNKYR